MLYLVTARAETLGSTRAHLERDAFRDTKNKRREAVIVFGRAADDRADRRLVGVLDAAAESVRHQVLGERAQHDVRPRHERLPQPVRAVDLRPVKQIAGRIDCAVAIFDPPGADDIEVLEREAERIDHTVARRALRALAMLLHALRASIEGGR